MKKLILLFLLVVLSFTCFGQSEIDKALFGKINKYRMSKGLRLLKWDTALYNMANHHSTYLSLINSAPYNKGVITHDEKYDVEGFDEINFSERGKFFTGDDNFYYAENCAMHNMPMVKKEVTEKEIIEKITDWILEQWITSPEHKKILETKKATTIGCSLVLFDLVVKSALKKDKTITFKNGMVAATMDIY